MQVSCVKCVLLSQYQCTYEMSVVLINSSFSVLALVSKLVFNAQSTGAVISGRLALEVLLLLSFRVLNMMYILYKNLKQE